MLKNINLYLTPLLLISIIALALSGCTIKPNLPDISVNPNNIVIIKGIKPEDINLRFALRFQTTNPGCKYKPFITAPLIPHIKHDVTLIPKGKKQFNTNFYLDKYSPGKCLWEPTHIIYSVDNNTKLQFDGAWNTLSAVNNKSDRSNISLHLICRKHTHKNKKYCVYEDKQKFKKSNPTISRFGGEIILSLSNK